LPTPSTPRMAMLNSGRSLPVGDVDVDVDTLVAAAELTVLLTPVNNCLL